MWWRFRHSKIIDRSTVTFWILAIFCVGIYFLNRNVPSGFIPNEDQGMIYAIIQTPPGSSLERTNNVAEQLQKMTEDMDDVKSVVRHEIKKCEEKGIRDWSTIKTTTRENLRDYIFAKTKRNPMIIPIIMEV